MLLVPQLLCLLGLALGTVHAAPLADEVKLERGCCPPSWFTFDGRCYKYVASRLTWVDAEWNCLEQDANLVSIHSEEENKFVQSLIQNFNPTQGFTWIGLSDVHYEGRWMWSDGSRARFARWGGGEPNGGTSENCVMFTTHGTEWIDHDCYNAFSSVCEVSP